MRYLPLTDADREEIKKAIGIKDTRDLFSCLPQKKCFPPLADIPAALSENELLQWFKKISAANTYPGFLSFLGGGCYRHFIPEVVNYLSAKGEFVTPYTPYQPEVSQGNLQAMFEYQTMMTMLTGMDVANASLYDGGTAAAEGVLLGLRKSSRRKVLLAASLHPEYAEIVRTYLQNIPCQLETVDVDPTSGKVNQADLRKKLDDGTALLLFQSPNFFGVIEEADTLSRVLHEKGAISLQAVAEAMALAYLKPPGENGVDIVVGEAQSFGLPLNFGGPTLGFMAVKEPFLRQMPGRIVGQTRDVDGKRGYVLTLSTREQHIKREKATSNICSNQAWCAIRAGMYLATMGKTGLEKIARLNHLNAVYFLKRLAGSRSKAKVRFSRDFYNELVLELADESIIAFMARMERQHILAGIQLGWFFPDMGNCLLINFTELHRLEDIDRLVRALGE